MAKEKVSFFLALCNTSLCFLVYFSFAQPVWGTNDDFYISSILSGFMISGEPSGNSIYVSSFLGTLLKYLYQWNSEILWYPLLQIMTVGVAILTLNYALIRLIKVSFLFTCLIVLSTTFFTLFPNLWHMQFSIVASLTSLAGGILLISLFVKPLSSNRLLFLLSFLSFGLILLGAQFRFQSVMMTVALLVPFALFLILNGFRNRPKYSLSIFIVTVFFSLASIYTLEYLNKLNYVNAEEWKEWVILDKAKSEFIDYRTVQFNDRTEPVFKEVGWNKIDFDMIRTWQYVDPAIYSPEKFYTLIERLKEERLLEKPFHNTFDVWLSGIMSIKNDIIFMSRTFYWIPFIIICSCLLFRWSLKDSIYLVPILISFLGVSLFLHIGVNRVPFRVLLMLYMNMVWLFLFIVVTRPSSLTYKLSFPKVLFLLLPPIIFILFMDISKTKKIVEDKTKGQEKVTDLVKIWTSKLPKNAILYVIGGAFPNENHLPFTSTKYLKSIQGFFPTGWMNQTPFQIRLSKKQSLNNNFFSSLSKKENVFVVGRLDNPKQEQLELTVLENFYEEKLGINLSYRKEPALPGLHKMIFNDKNKGVIKKESHF